MGSTASEANSPLAVSVFAYNCVRELDFNLPRLRQKGEEEERDVRGLRPELKRSATHCRIRACHWTLECHDSYTRINDGDSRDSDQAA